MPGKPDFERFRTAVLRETPDRVPLGELIIDNVVIQPWVGRPCDSMEVYMEFLVAAGYDFARVTPHIDFNPDKVPPKEGLRIGKAHEKDWDRTWSPEGQGVITSWDDLERHRWPTPDDVDYAPLHDAYACLPDGMKIVAHHGDIFTTAWALMGFETFCFALAEDPDLVAAVYERIGRVVLRAFEVMATLPGIGAMWYSDDIAYTEGLLVSPAHFRAELFPRMKAIGDMCRAKNIPFLYHTDGVLWEVMEDIIDCGVDCIQPIEPKAMDIVEVKRRYGDRLSVMGNIDLGYTLTRGTPEETAEEVRERLRTVGPGGGYILGSSNTISNYVLYDNYRAMVETTLASGNYPISC